MGTARDLCLLVIVCVAISRSQCYGFANNYDGLMNFRCGRSLQAVSEIYSVHHNFYEDRVFLIFCRDVPEARGQGSCYFSDNWENSYDGLLDFECRSNGFITGMTSQHHNFYEDRRWKFWCCKYANATLYDCENTNWTNDFDGLQSYIVPTGMVIKGVTSYHHNIYEDRLYKYNICKVRNLLK